MSDLFDANEAQRRVEEKKLRDKLKGEIAHNKRIQEAKEKGLEEIQKIIQYTVEQGKECVHIDRSSSRQIAEIADTNLAVDALYDVPEIRNYLLQKGYTVEHIHGSDYGDPYNYWSISWYAKKEERLQPLPKEQEPLVSRVKNSGCVMSLIAVLGMIIIMIQSWRSI